MSRKKRILTLVSISATLLLFFFFVRLRNEKISEENKSQEHSLEKPQAIKPVKEGEELLNSPLLRKNAELEQLAWKAGLNRMTLDRNQEGARLVVKIVPEEVCHPGDADIIRIDLKAKPSMQVWLSLESLESSSSLNVEAQLVSEKELLSQGGEYVFNLPHLSKPAQMGLFMCSDSIRTKKCSSKAVVDLNEVLNSQFVAQRDNVTYQPQDRNYFFQYLLVEDGAVTSLRRELSSSEERLLAEYIQKSGATNQKEWETTKRYLQSLRSFYPVLQGKTLTIRVPHFGGKCTPGSKK